ncbi:hypothetical protein [Antarcticirhabdus aurantiaca]|uniref:Uncharacterized protein n=1 Tax=Antarcticirhabdus aurantiaca TaxID=2606717 RepID=A0ACD4NKI1_9HYPH|nr:hypothetical protein [Antarcticirhabdus aurantiaca]WAJ27296.1 hypothetical protein OXU80_20960 [Jeongeuplla avenae]
MSRAQMLVEAVDGMDKRLEEVFAFLRALDEGADLDRERLGHAIHQCANVQQSMGALRRLVKRIEG